MDSTANTSAMEREIDELVYKLYGLTEEEIQVVEEKLVSNRRLRQIKALEKA